MGDRPLSLQALLIEFRRRKVFRVAAVYAIVAWALIEVADVLGPALLLPDWITRAVAFILILGFPVALLLTWAFEMTPEGVRRTEGAADGTGGGPPPRRPARSAGLAGALGLTGVLALALLGYTQLRPATSVSDTIERSIAVLPFADMSATGDHTYLSNGITEDILTALAKVADLQVTSRTSVMQYRETTKTVPEIGRELDVAYVLEGSLQREGDHVRVNAQLIDARTDRHVWAETYDRQITSIFQIQRDIAERITQALRAELSPKERERIAAAGTGDVAAYELYLKGREALYHEQITPDPDDEGVAGAIALFRESLDRDPEYALAFAGLSNAFLMRSRPSAKQWLDSARVAAEQAIILGPELAEGHEALARVYRVQGKRTRAVELLERAVELNPGYADAIVDLAALHLDAARLNEAYTWAKRAIAVEPNRGEHYHTVADVWWALGDYGEADGWLRRGIEVEPGNATLHRHLSIHHTIIGRLHEAEVELRIVAALAPEWQAAQQGMARIALLRGDFHQARAYFEEVRNKRAERRGQPAMGGNASLALAYQKLGATHLAAAELSRIESRAREQIESGDETAGPYRALAEAHALGGDADAALAALDEAIQRGEWDALYAADPVFESIRDDPRFREIFDRLKAGAEAMGERIRKAGV